MKFILTVEDAGDQGVKVKTEFEPPLKNTKEGYRQFSETDVGIVATAVMAAVEDLMPEGDDE